MSSSITLSYEKFMLVKRAIVDSLSEDPPVDSYINNWVKNNIS
jgi:hypothetical protein